MTKAGQAIVELDNVSFTWPGQDSPILEIEQLRLEPGENLFVRGASGSGKTTLLNLLAAIHLPTTGDIRLLGSDIAALSPSRRDKFRADHIGVVFQQFNLLPYMSLVDNVKLACAFSARKREKATAKTDLNEAARRLLRSLNLQDEVHKSPVAELSVGQQQRVAVARALIGGPELVIADEPTSALDTDNRDRFLDLLFREATVQNCTLVFVSHDESLARRFDRMIELSINTDDGAPVDAVEDCPKECTLSPYKLAADSSFNRDQRDTVARRGCGAQRGQV